VDKKALKVLELSSSGRHAESVTRRLSQEVLSALEAHNETLEVSRRDLSAGLPFVDSDWIEANFTPDDDRTQAHRDTLAGSDALVEELKNADVLVIGAPIYNFSIPASLKAWIDMIARARLTFRYTETGPVGLLTGKKAYVVVATGGVPVGSAMDFATPYLRHALSFVGITDIEIIAADKINSNADDALNRARAQIAQLFELSAFAA
jgi:FMN-dependent NADH-azoreductase